ncbi:MAG: diguanylate cyclase domain-containing protein [Candidatus Azotimanducaceae bacterium WSBS_2022_MAG_OTU7]
MNDNPQTSAYLKLIDIGKALSAEKNLDSLLKHILLEAKSLANAKAGTIYLNSDKASLEFSIVLSDALSIVRRGGTVGPMDLPEIPLYNEDGSPNLNNIASFAVHRGDTIVVDDAAKIEKLDFSGSQVFSKLLNRDVTSVLTVPLKTMGDESLGVLQLLNANDDQGNVSPFEEEIIPLIEALSSQASVAIENRALLDEQEHLKNQLEREVDIRTEELKDALTKLSEAHTLLKEMNTIDAVTGIRNRQYFDKTLEQEWRRAKRQGYDISLLLLDIDHFKKVNDTYGHLAGDECLACIAQEIDKMFNRPPDIVARYGGEEFAVVLPYISAENAQSLAEQLRQLIGKATYTGDGHELNVTVSIGVATVSPDKGGGPRDLVGLSDTVLYEAKSTGRNRVCQYHQ